MTMIQNSLNIDNAQTELAAQFHPTRKSVQVAGGGKTPMIKNAVFMPRMRLKLSRSIVSLVTFSLIKSLETKVSAHDAKSAYADWNMR
jgi:hypothetical protein